MSRWIRRQKKCEHAKKVLVGTDELGRKEFRCPTCGARIVEDPVAT